jgi:uncharacterized protein YndB with AHSA1/START domain
MPFDKTVFLPLDPRTVFEMITQPERLRRWKTVAARVDLRIGGEYRWTIVPGHSAMGTFSEIEPGKSLHFTWGWQGDAELPPGASTVSITLNPVEGGTNLRLVHGNLTPEQTKGHAEGWNHYLDRLVEFASNGKIGADPWSYDPRPVDAFTSAEAALVIIQRILRTLTESDLDKVTSYHDFTVQQIIDHLCDHLAEIAPPVDSTPLNFTTDSAEARFANLGQMALETFRNNGTEAEITFNSTLMPSRVVADFLTLEFLVHAWDLAMATNQKIDVSPILIDYINESSSHPDLIDETKVSQARLIDYSGRQLIEK